MALNDLGLWQAWWWLSTKPVLLLRPECEFQVHHPLPWVPEAELQRKAWWLWFIWEGLLEIRAAAGAGRIERGGNPGCPAAVTAAALSRVVSRGAFWAELQSCSVGQK